MLKKIGALFIILIGVSLVFAIYFGNSTSTRKFYRIDNGKSKREITENQYNNWYKNGEDVSYFDLNDAWHNNKTKHIELKENLKVESYFNYQEAMTKGTYVFAFGLILIGIYSFYVVRKAAA